MRVPTQVIDPIFVTDPEIRSQGGIASGMDVFRGGLPVQQLFAIAGPTPARIILPPGTFSELIKNPLNVGDIVRLTNTVSSDGRYRVLSIVETGALAFHEIRVVALFAAVMANQGAPAPAAAPLAGVTLDMIYEEGEHRIGGDTTGLVVATGPTLQDQIKQLDTAVAAATGAFGYFFGQADAGGNPDYAATVLVNAPVPFPQLGPAAGGIVPGAANSFVLPSAGTYEIRWQVSVTEAGQLSVYLNINGGGYLIRDDTTVGRATGTSQIVGLAVITVTLPSLVQIRNPAGNAAALTVTPIAGGTHTISASLFIRIA